MQSTAEDLAEHFGSFGSVQDVVIPLDDLGRSRCVLCLLLIAGAAASAAAGAAAASDHAALTTIRHCQLSQQISDHHCKCTHARTYTQGLCVCGDG